VNRNALKYFIILAILSVAGIFLIQFAFLKNTFEITEQEFQESTTIALREVAWQILEASGQTSKFDNIDPVEKVSNHYYLVNVNDIIDPEVLKTQLKEQFTRHTIHLDFEYAIYDCQTDKMVYGNHINMGQKQRNPVKIEMPKYDEFIYYFGIYFPERNQSISGNIGITYLLSALLILVTLFFGYALIVVLKQRRLTEIQNTVVNNLTHEFKTPLSSILLSTEVLIKDEILNEPDRLKNYTQIIKTQTQNLLSQVERILGMGELENTNNLKLEEINLNNYLLTFNAEIEEKVNSKSGRFFLDLHAEKSIICADQFHVSNLIYNLIDNSIKYSVKNPEITISTFSDQNFLFLKFKDNGIGIDKKYHTKIYKKFFRIPTGNIHNVKGFGLGLHYVYSIIKKHHWKIKLESKPEIGSTFIIRIPLKNGNCD